MKKGVRQSRYYEGIYNGQVIASSTIIREACNSYLELDAEMSDCVMSQG
jgi:hypothetical protein